MMINMTGAIQWLNSSPKGNGEEPQVELNLHDVEQAVQTSSPAKVKVTSVTFATHEAQNSQLPPKHKYHPQRPLNHPYPYSQRYDCQEDLSFANSDDDNSEICSDSNKLMANHPWVLPTQTQLQQMMVFEPDQAVGLGNAVSDRRNHKSFVRQRKQFSPTDLDLNSSHHKNINKNNNKNPSNKNNPNNNNNDPKFSSVEYMEARARKMAIKNPFVLFFLHFYAGVKILFKYLITLDSVLGCIMTVGMTCYWYYSKATERKTNSWDGTMSFVLVTFAVVSPITVAIRMAFTRREEALRRIASIRSYFLHIYFAHSLWDWKSGGGRAANKLEFDYLEHCDGVLEQLIGIGDELARFLSLPNTSRGWNRTTNAGRAEAVRTVRAAYGLLESVTLQRMVRLTCFSEEIKKQGLGGSEISRVRAFERNLSDQLEQLRMLKMYRTPQAMWAFARVFTIVLPAFYGPAFAQVAHDLQSLTVGIMFSVLTTLVLTALLEAVQVLEDPFTAYVSLDGVDVSEEFEVLSFTQLVKARKLFFPSAAVYPLRASTALMGLHYDPMVHFHATDEEREVVWQRDRNMALQEARMNPKEDTRAARTGVWTKGISGSNQKLPRMSVWSERK
jgi:hypothetical protein